MNKALSDYQVLSGYDEEDLSKSVISLQTQSLEVRGKYKALQKFVGCHSQEDYEVFLSDKEKREKFYLFLLEFSKSLKLLFSGEGYQRDFGIEKIAVFKKALKFYVELRCSVQIRYTKKWISKLMKNKVQELIDLYIGANEAEVLVELVLRLDEVFMQKSQKPDWEHNLEVSKQIDQEIDDLLYEYGVYISSDEVEKFIIQVREIGQKNYATC